MPRSAAYLLSADQFDRNSFEEFFAETDKFKQGLRHDRLAWANHCRGRIMLSLFFAPSLRTAVSFKMAATRLGITDIPADTKNFSDQYKGEDPMHTIRVVAGYNPDVIVIRHRKTGGVLEIVRMMEKCLGGKCTINAGDGLGEHPTQALIDLYTMISNIRSRDLSGVPICVGGDLTGRAARSLIIGLCKFGAHIILCSPETLRLDAELQKRLAASGASFVEERRMEQALKDARFIYWTRTQTEHRSQEENEALNGFDPRDYQIREGHLAFMRPDAQILHPLPINRTLPGTITEIAPEIDNLPQALYWEQAKNGVPVRMACLARCLES